MYSVKLKENGFVYIYCSRCKHYWIDGIECCDGPFSKEDYMARRNLNKLLHDQNTYDGNMKYEAHLDDHYPLRIKKIISKL